MFRPPTKYSEYLQDVRKSIDYILKRVNATTVNKIVAGTNVTISPADGTGIVTINASGGGGGGLPAGGTTGQILAKINNVDYNAQWIDNFALWTSTVQHEVKASEPINKGQAVYVSGADGTNMIVSKASNTSEATSSKTMGLLAQTLATNGKGFVITEGLLAGLNTSGATAGDPVWLGASGNLIYGLINKPYAPLNLVFIGIVTRVNANNGEIFVKVQNGFELDELHNVDARNPNNNDGIFYNSSTMLWEHKPVSAVYATPTLAQVTTAGNTTTNAITVGGLTSNGIINAGSNLIGRNDWNQGIVNFGSTGEVRFVNGTGGGHFFTWYQNGGTANERMRLSTSNNLLIGTTTDSGYKLDVNGTGRFSSTLTIATAATDASPSNSILITTANSGNGGRISWGDSNTSILRYSNSLYFREYTGNFRFESTGSGAALVYISSVSTSVLSGKFITSGSTTAASALAQGVYFNNTLVAAANNDVLVGLDINPTFTNGAFTGVSNLALRVAYVAGRYISFRAAPGYADFGQIVFSNVTGADITSSGTIGLGPSDTYKTLTLGNGITSKITTPGSTKYDSYGNQTPATLGVTTNRPFLFTSTIPDGGIDGFIFENTSSGSRNLFKVIQNNTTLFTLNPNGNVLIGTTTDAGYKLDVNGTARVSGNLTLGAEVFGPINTYFNGPTVNTGTLWLRFNAVNSNGNFTASGVVQGSVVTASGTHSVLSSIGGGVQGVIISNTTTLTDWRIEGHRTTSGALEFKNDLTNPVLNLFSSRNVGIGTFTDAGYKLDVNGTARVQTSLEIVSTAGVTFGGGATALSWAGGSQLHLGNSATWADVRFYTGAILKYSQTSSVTTIVNTTINLATTTVQLAGVNALTYSGTDIRIGSVSAGFNSLSLYVAGSEKARIDSSGNFGLGTTNPTDKFHIVDNTNGNKFGRISAGGTDASAAWVAQNDQVDNVVYRVFGSAVTGTQMGISLARSASLMANLGGSGKFLVGTYSATDFVMGTGNQERMRLVDSTGNFLIGTTTDAGYRLNVSGSIRSTLDVVAEGNLKSNYQAGNEGGEINLNTPATGTTINTGVTIDVYQNKLRIFESGGLNRGGYFDISALANGVGTNFSPVGYTGILNILGNPPGQQNIDIQNGIIINIF